MTLDTIGALGLPQVSVAALPLLDVLALMMRLRRVKTKPSVTL